MTRARRQWLFVALFAIGMAWVEAATVYYLRVMVDRLEPYQANPLPVHGVLGQVELVREAATLVMLFAVGAVAGRTWWLRFAYSVIAFGVWDVFYYVFLRVMYGWPKSLLDWDVLFLIPLPWWGPVLAPVSIALLMIVWGTLVTERVERSPAPAITSMSWRLSCVGTTLALYVFMADSLRAIAQGLDVRTVLPQTFNWPLFLLALALMAAPVVRLVWGIRTVAVQRRLRETSVPSP